MKVSSRRLGFTVVAYSFTVVATFAAVTGKTSRFREYADHRKFCSLSLRTPGVRAALQADPTINDVFGAGSADTEAAGLDIERHFSNRDYVAAGFDLSPDILRTIQAGIIRFSIDQQPYSQGYLPVVNLRLLQLIDLLVSRIGLAALQARQGPFVSRGNPDDLARQSG